MTRDQIKVLAANHGMLGQMVTTNLLCAFYEKIAPAQRAAAVQEMLAAAKEEVRKEAMGDGEPVGEVRRFVYEYDEYDRVSHVATFTVDVPDKAKLYTAPPSAMLMRVAKEVRNTVIGSLGRNGGDITFDPVDLAAIVDRVMGEQK